jgi:hypothetical protein
MVLRLFSLCAILILAAGLFSTPAAAQRVCGDRGDIAGKLKFNYSEGPVAMGLSMDGSVIEVFASNSGSFTILKTHPSGVTCVIVTGESWEGMSPGASDARI